MAVVWIRATSVWSSGGTRTTTNEPCVVVWIITRAMSSLLWRRCYGSVSTQARRWP